MTVTVRALHPEDTAGVEGFAHVRHMALPFFLITPKSLAYDITHAHPDAHFQALVAEQDGEVIGTAQTAVVHDSPEPGQGFVNVYVHPERTGRGAGSLLVRTAERHLAAAGVTKSFAWVLDAPATTPSPNTTATAPAAARTSSAWTWQAAHCPAPGPPPGVELRTGADFAADPRPLFDLDAETTSDEPSDVDYEFTDYEAWLRETWHHPLLSHELTTIALVDGRPAAFSAARTDGATRYGTVMTGTARDFRGRGLAKLAKNDSLHRARSAGYTEALTGNDAGNGPMIAINKWFGYEICATEVRYVRELI